MAGERGAGGEGAPSPCPPAAPARPPGEGGESKGALPAPDKPGRWCRRPHPGAIIRSDKQNEGTLSGADFPMAAAWLGASVRGALSYLGACSGRASAGCLAPGPHNSAPVITRPLSPADTRHNGPKPRIAGPLNQPPLTTTTTKHAPTWTTCSPHYKPKMPPRGLKTYKQYG